MADPVATLRAAGATVPDGVTLKVHENTDDEVHLALPTFSDDDAVRDADLERIAGGKMKPTMYQTRECN